MSELPVEPEATRDEPKTGDGNIQENSDHRDVPDEERRQVVAKIAAAAVLVQVSVLADASKSVAFAS